MASMTQVPDHYVTAYETAWTHLVQQMESRLRDKAKVKPAEGAATRFNQYAPRSMAAISTRAASTPNTDANLPVRWAYSSPYDDSALFDTWDSLFLGQVVLPTSETVQSQAAAWNRTVDQTLLTQLVGTGYQTTTGTTPTNGGVFAGGGVVPTIASVAFDSTNQVVSNTFVPFGGTAVTSGLTIAKIRRAKRKMDLAEVPSEGRHLAISSKELEDLLATTEVTNQLYNSVRALIDGDVDTFLGFQITRTELLPWYNATGPVYNNVTDVATTGIRTVVAWQKDMVGLIDGGKKAFMDVLPTQSHALQIRTTAVIGAARLQEKGVVAILCDTNA
jgi:Phage capsid protein